MKKTIVCAVLFLFLGNVCFAGEVATPTPPNRYYNIGGGAIVAGFVLTLLANDYEKQYSDPKKYDQKKVADTADNERTIGIAFMVGGALLILLGIEEDKKKEKTSISIEERNDGGLLVAKYSF